MFATTATKNNYHWTNHNKEQEAINENQIKDTRTTRSRKGSVASDNEKKYTVALEDLLQTYPMITHEDTIRREGAQKNF